MTATLLLMGALAAAPLFSQPGVSDPVMRKSEVVWFSLTENRAEVTKKLGPPAAVADFGEDYQAWHYHIGNHDLHDYSHFLVFRRSTGKLVSVTRVYEEEQNVDVLFPDSGTAVHFMQDSAYGARVRRLPGGRVLIAMGSTGKGRPTRQLMLVGESDLRNFHDWLYASMTRGER